MHVPVRSCYTQCPVSHFNEYRKMSTICGINPKYETSRKSIRWDGAWGQKDGQIRQADSRFSTPLFARPKSTSLPLCPSATNMGLKQGASRNSLPPSSAKAHFQPDQKVEELIPPWRGNLDPHFFKTEAACFSSTPLSIYETTRYQHSEAYLRTYKNVRSYSNIFYKRHLWA